MPLAVIAVSSALTVAYAGRWWFGAFGSTRGISPVTAARPKTSMLLAPVVLGVLTVGFGIDPRPLADAVKGAVGQSVKLVLWPGFTPALAVSSVVVRRRGVALPRERTQTELHRERRTTPLPRAADVYMASLRGLLRTADTVTGSCTERIAARVPRCHCRIRARGARSDLAVHLESVDLLAVWNQPSELVLAVIAATGAVPQPAYSGAWRQRS